MEIPALTLQHPKAPYPLLRSWWGLTKVPSYPWETRSQIQHPCISPLKEVTLTSLKSCLMPEPLHLMKIRYHFHYKVFLSRSSILKGKAISSCFGFDLLQHGSTPIHIAAKFGHTELISKFAAAGVNLRQVSRKTGLSALHVASFYGMEGKIIPA